MGAPKRTFAKAGFTAFTPGASMRAPASKHANRVSGSEAKACAWLFNGTDGWKCCPWGGGLVKSSHRIEELVYLPTNLPKNAQLNVGKYT